MARHVSRFSLLASGGDGRDASTCAAAEYVPTSTEADEVAGVPQLGRWQRRGLLRALVAAMLCGLLMMSALATRRPWLSAGTGDQDPMLNAAGKAGKSGVKDQAGVTVAHDIMASIKDVVAFTGSSRASSSSSHVPQGVAGAVRDPDTGCMNWRGMSLGPATIQASAGACVDLCRKTPGCHAVNYKTEDCGDDRLCYVLGDTCDKVSKGCWDLYTVPEMDRKKTSSGFHSTAQQKYRTSCSNLTQITEPATEEWSVYLCKTKCELDSDCSGIVFQPGSCTGPTALKQNYCYLLHGHCDEVHDDCWDYYPKSVESGSKSEKKSESESKSENNSESKTPANAPTTTTTAPNPYTLPPDFSQKHPKVHDKTFLKEKVQEGMNRITLEQDYFNKGDKVVICSQEGKDEVTIKATSSSGDGSYFVEPALRYDHAKRTPVARRPRDGGPRDACAEFVPTTSTTTLKAEGCQDIGDSRDEHEDACSWYVGHENNCGDRDDDDFTATQTCCACGGGDVQASECENRNGIATDRLQNSCADDIYDKYYDCGDYDDTDFTAKDMCCNCFLENNGVPDTTMFGTSRDAKEGERDIYVFFSRCFLIGDEVTIVSAGTTSSSTDKLFIPARVRNVDQLETGKRHAGGEGLLRLTAPIPYDIPKDSPVLRHKKGFKEKNHCGEWTKDEDLES